MINIKDTLRNSMLVGFILMVGVFLVGFNIVFAESDLTITGSNYFSGETGEVILVDDLEITGTPDGDVSVKLLASEGFLEMTTTTNLSFTGDPTGDTIFFSGTLADVNAALATLEYTRLTNGSDTLEVSLVDPGEVFFSENGHLYEYITDAGDWNSAKTKAEALTRYGASGYLATITSQNENDFVSDRLEDAGWMGANDVASEGDWQWVTGPENGTSFWSGNGSGSAVGGAYENWNQGEPNDSSGEDCGQFLSGGSGQWNDLPCSGTSLPGYVAEFGAPGDLPDVEAKNITIETSTTPVVTQLSPIDNATAGSTSHELVMTFDQSIDVQSGNISLYTADDDQLVEAIDVAGGPVSGAGTDTITIAFSDTLDINTDYYVQVDTTVFRNLSGLEFPGIQDNTTWNFTTTGIGSGVVAYTPENPVIVDESDSVIVTFTLDEPIISAEPNPSVILTLVNLLPDDLDFDTTTLLWEDDEWAESRSVTISLDDSFVFSENINTLIEFSVESEAEYYNGRASAIPLLIGSVGIDAPIPIQSLVESSDFATVDILEFTLESRPTEEVTITPIATADQISFDPANITFTFDNWNEPQSITTTAIDDDEYEDVHQDVITFEVSSEDSNYDNFVLDDVVATIIDDDPRPRSSSSRVSVAKVRALFADHYATKKENQNQSPIANQELDNEYQCSPEQIITQNLRAPSRNGAFDAYTGGIVTDAKILQKHLNRLGFNSGVKDGIIGPLTDGAIKRMQAFLGTISDGYVGPITRKLINESCSERGLEN